MYDILTICPAVLVALAQGYCLQYFLGSFLGARGRGKRLNNILVMFLLGTLKVAMNYILPSGDESSGTIVKAAFLFFIVALLALCFYKGAYTTKIFLVVTFMAVSEITFFLSYVFMQVGSNLFDLWIWFMEKGYIASERALELYVQITALALQLLLYGIYIFLLYIILKKVNFNFRDKEYRIHGTELCFLIAPGIVGLLICMLLRVIMITIENDTPKLLYDKHPVLTAIVPAILALSLSSIVYGVKLFQDLVSLNREKSSRIILEKQVGSMQEHIEEMERIYSGIASIRHDMKNTLAVIMQLVGKKDGMENKELQAYLSDLNQTIDSFEMKYKTGNTVVDILLNMKYHEAVRLIPDIRIDAENLFFPENLNIHSYDIGVIIGNALDNAIEACNKLKAENREAEAFIGLSSFKKGKMIFVEVENSFNGKIVKKKNSEFPATEKRDKKAHGMGLMNIKKTAEKYHGAVDWSVNGKVFILSVMMKDERREENED